MDVYEWVAGGIFFSIFEATGESLLVVYFGAKTTQRAGLRESARPEVRAKKYERC